MHNHGYRTGEKKIKYFMGTLSCEKVVNRLGPHFVAREEEGVVERMCNEWNHNPHPPTLSW